MGCMQGKTAQRKKVEDSFANGRAKQHLLKKSKQSDVLMLNSDDNYHYVVSMDNKTDGERIFI